MNLAEGELDVERIVNNNNNNNKNLHSSDTVVLVASDNVQVLKATCITQI
jgi:hypothetical protein